VRGLHERTGVEFHLGPFPSRVLTRPRVSRHTARRSKPTSSSSVSASGHRSRGEMPAARSDRGSPSDAYLRRNVPGIYSGRRRAARWPIRIRPDRNSSGSLGCPLSSGQTPPNMLGCRCPRDRPFLLERAYDVQQVRGSRGTVRRRPEIDGDLGKRTHEFAIYRVGSRAGLASLQSVATRKACGPRFRQETCSLLTGRR